MRRSTATSLTTAVLAIGIFGSCDSSSSTNPEMPGNGTSTTAGWNASVTYGSLTDARDGKSYKTVKIGTQTWMAENLSYMGTSALLVGVWYDNSSENGAKYGRLYTWAEAVAGHASSAVNPSGIQGVCPNGWHVPSDTEWTILTTFIGGEASAGSKLMATGGYFTAGNGTDAYGFRALPGGTHNADGTFANAGIAANFWSTSEYLSSAIAWSRMLGIGSGSVMRVSDVKAKGLSLRCVEDAVVQAPAGSVVVPVFSPTGGTYSTTQSVTLSSSTSGATIYYTIDGSTPTTSSTKYTSPVQVSASKTLKAIAVKSVMTTSSVGFAVYTIQVGGNVSGPIPWNTSISYGTLTDTRDGQIYKTVVIGTQTWMAENLSYKVDSSWCYENSADSCSKYGRLYNWVTVMGLDSAYNSELWSGALPRQGICPSGWHVPSDAEWSMLPTFLDSSKAGTKLKSTSGWLNSGNGTDVNGFRALPEGTRNKDGFFSLVGRYAYFWSSSESRAGYARGIDLGSGFESLVRGDSFKKYGFSVRCLKD
ncbi:MAG: chitobiase/beta-hexosaminidase C-terminal domain-containing protein [Fibrobacteres bacterium]|jgi:uncharacterized protein (TIGR02145 family)|nr:chitobiase/beta-hexosaminidase C-terminal domain-containing protein [Fibrobacterota bacterium]